MSTRVKADTVKIVDNNDTIHTFTGGVTYEHHSHGTYIQLADGTEADFGNHEVAQFTAENKKR